MHNHTAMSDGDGDPELAFASMRDAGLDVADLVRPERSDGHDRALPIVSLNAIICERIHKLTPRAYRGVPKNTSGA